MACANPDIPDLTSLLRKRLPWTLQAMTPATGFAKAPSLRAELAGRAAHEAELSRLARECFQEVQAQRRFDGSLSVYPSYATQRADIAICMRRCLLVALFQFKLTPEVQQSAAEEPAPRPCCHGRNSFPRSSGLSGQSDFDKNAISAEGGHTPAVRPEEARARRSRRRSSGLLSSVYQSKIIEHCKPSAIYALVLKVLSLKVLDVSILGVSHRSP